MSTRTILLIDDSEDFRLIAGNLLLDEGYDVWEAPCPHDAFALLKREHFDLILCDLHMPFMTGPEGADYETSYRVGINTIRELQGLFPETPVVAITSTDPSSLSNIREVLQGIPTFSKPKKRAELMTIVEASLDPAFMQTAN